MAHGYLAAQFFAAALEHARRRLQRRRSRPGCASPARCSRAVRAEAGDGVAVGVRLAADEITPDGFGPEACAEIAAALCAGSEIDFVSAALGLLGDLPRLDVHRPAAARAARGDRRAGRARCARRSRACRSSAPRGSRTSTRPSASSAPATVDLVGMTRAMIADPDLLAKARAGRADEVIPCIGCNQGCIGHYHAGLPIACTVNPRTGRERTLPRPRPADGARRRVLVVGRRPGRRRGRARGRRRGPRRSCSPSARRSSAASCASRAARPATARCGSATRAGSPTGS